MSAPEMTDASPDAPDDIRPRVAGAPSRLPLYAFIGVALVGSAMLFSALDARRRAITAPATRPAAADLVGMPPDIAPLYIPPEDQASPPAAVATFVSPVAPAPIAPAPIPRQQAPVPQPPQQIPPVSFGPPPPTQAQSPPISSGPAVVFDSGAPAGSDEGGKSGGKSAIASSGAAAAGRVSAGHLSNPGTTIPQGAIIHAVLETALNSTQAGLARAIVSDDVHGFDGTRVLIPRGSRLIGEYSDQAERGQNRALIMWTRLIRPDGVTIALQSPVADPLGRVGVKAAVNTHFLERFGGAILQSALDVGVGLATRQVYGGTVVVGLPGSTTNLPQVASGGDVKPTLKVRQGTSVSVFVARDLDFTTAEGAR